MSSYKSTNKIRHAFLLLVLVAFFLEACGAAVIAKPTEPRATLRFSCNNKNAILEIDETRLGPVGMFEKQGVLLKPGTHRIIVKGEDFFPEYILVDLVENEIKTIDIVLKPIP